MAPACGLVRQCVHAVGAEDSEKEVQHWSNAGSHMGAQCTKQMSAGMVYSPASAGGARQQAGAR